VKPVDQRHINKDTGDCETCAIASILELPYEAVPLFVKDDVEKGINWFQALFKFLGERGCQPSGIIVGTVPDPQAALLKKWSETVLAHLPLPRYIEASGPSPRGEWGHAVVWDTVEGRIVHDPHPSRAGLRGGPTAFMVLLPSADVEDAYARWQERKREAA
jgi:hypothetical protein